MPFTLVGFDNPFGRGYPAPVIPVGRLNGRLAAIYPAGQRREDFIPEDSSFVHFSSEELKALEGFDPDTERLFARSAHEVLRYRTDDEKAFINAQLEDADLFRNYPEMQRILQQIIGGE